MEKTKILWSGITGRTGVCALELAKQSNSVEIVAGICRSNPSYYHYNELDNIKEDFDVIVDFSHKDSFNEMLKFAIKAKKPIIVGTAGLTENQIKDMEEAANIIPVFRGGNFRFEVKEFIDDVVEYAKKSDEDIIELIETHYKTKKIPSETAKVIAKRVLEETGKKVEIKSFLEYDELINDWRVAPLNCRVIGVQELAKDVLTIAELMKNKKPKGIYDLDRLLKEKANEEFSKFLIEAKKQTYANENIKKGQSSRVGSHDYEYKNENMIYHDTYFGGTNFMGEEVVYESNNNTPIWGMNYYGVTLDETLSEEAIDKALRPALMKVGDDDILPVRGPKEYKNKEYKYTFHVTGNIEYFEGEEIIYKKDKKIYILKCHGGRIKN